MLLATAENRQTNKRQSQQRLTIVKTVGFVFTPCNIDSMAIVQIGGFYTAINLGGHMAIPFAAGGAAMKILRMLYKGKKKIGKGTSIVADKAAKGGFTKTSQVISGTAQKTHKGTMKAKMLAKKYPKSAAAITGAIGYDIFDDD